MSVLPSPLRRSHLFLPGCLFFISGILTTCVDGPQATDVFLAPPSTISLNPVIDPNLAAGETADIHQIRIKAYLAGTDSLLGETTQAVDPRAGEWSLGFSIHPPSGSQGKVLLTVELINISGSGESVEWSGRIGPLTILPGSSPEIRDVPVVRGPLDNLSVTGVSIDGPVEAILERDTHQLSATATSSDPGTQPQIFWSSLDPSVASVSTSGLLMGVMPGEARIVATAGVYADTITATILPRPGKMELTPGSALVQALGDEVSFSARILDGRGAEMPEEAIVWTLESTEILEEMGDGRYRALSRGATVVTATSVSAPEVTASAQVVVQQAVESVEVLPQTGRLTARGDTLRFSAQAFDANANPILGMDFTWSTSNTQIATMDAGGLATAFNSGVVVVKARAGVEIMTSSAMGTPTPGLVGEARLEVARETTGVEITPASHTFVSIGEGSVFSARAVDANGFTIPGRTFTWSSSDPAVVTVGTNGLAVSVADGEATITSSADGHEEYSIVTVAQAAHHLHWVIQPPDGIPGVPLDPPPSVEVVDQLGTRVASFADPIALNAILNPGSEPQAVPIQGTDASLPSAGLAVFPDVGLATSGTYALTAGTPALPSAQSQPFTIVSGDLTDLALGMDVSGATFAEGDVAEFYLTLENLGPSDATNVVVTDVLPSGVTLLIASMDPPAGWNSITGEWTVASLLVGATATLSLEVEIDAGTTGSTLTNSASITSLDQTDTNGTNNAASADIYIAEAPQNWTGPALGNTQLLVGSFPPPTTPYVQHGLGNLLAPTPSLTISSVGTFATAQGGSVTIEADGDFLYTPPADYQGPDLFGFSTVGGGSALTTITVSDRVWYVDNTNPSAGTGLSNDPFQTLAQAQAASSALASPDPIYLDYGDGSAYTGGISLRPTQGLYGEGAGLSLPAWPGLQNTAPASYPEITNPAGYGVQLGSGSAVEGVNIITTSSAGILASGSGGSADRVYIVDANIGINLDYATGTFDFTNMSISNSTNRGFYVYAGDPVVNYQGDLTAVTAHNQLLYVGSTTGGSVNLSGVFNSQGASTEAIFLSGNDGTVTVDGPLSIVDPAGGGVSLDYNSGDVTFSSLSINAPNAPGITAANNTGLTTITGGSVTTTGRFGLDFRDSPLNANFADLYVNNTSAGEGGVYLENTAPGTVNFTRLRINSSAPDGGAFFSNAGTVNVTSGPDSYITAFGVHALFVSNTQININLATLTSQDPAVPGFGVGAYLSDATGSLTATGGILSNPQTPAGTSLQVVGGSVDVSYGGQVRNLQPEAWAVQVGGRTGGSIILSGFVEDSGRGIQIGGSAGANLGGLVAFTGGMSLIGPGYLGAPPFYAFGPVTNGSLEITGTNNTIAAPVGYQAMEINNTIIGPAGVTLRQIQADGDFTIPNGVVLNNTGAGSFSITGDGTAGSGGYVSNMAQNGINLTNTGPVSLSYLGINGNIEFGILGANVGGLDVIESTISGAANLQAIKLDNLNGPSQITNSTLSNANGPTLVQVLNTVSSAFTLDVVNSSFTVGSPIGSTAFLVGTGDTSSGVLNVDGSSFTNSGYGIQVYAQGSSTMDLNISNGSVFNTNQRGLYFWQGDGATLRFDIQDSNFLGNTLYGINGISVPAALAAGEMTGQVLNTTIQNSPDGILVQYPGAASGYLRFQGNAIDPTDGRGIQVQAGTAGAAGSASVGVEASGNVFNVDLTGPGIYLNNYSGTTMCAAINTNTIDVITAGDWLAVEQGQSTATFNLEGLNGGAGFVTNSATISAYLEGTNTLLGGGIAQAFLNTGIYGVPVGSCIPAGIFP